MSVRQKNIKAAAVASSSLRDAVLTYQEVKEGVSFRVKDYIGLGFRQVAANVDGTGGVVKVEGVVDILEREPGSQTDEGGLLVNCVEKKAP